MFDSIFLCADFLATKESEQANNTRWLIDILKRPMHQAANILPVEFKSAVSEKNGFVRNKFFALSNVNLDPKEMQFDFNSNNINQESISYLKEHIPESALVVGYEFSAATREIMDRCKITYIDIWLHPIRYLDDVLFAFNSNKETIKEALQKYNLNEDIYFSYADRLRVQNYKGFRRAKLDLLADSALFVGQTLYDKAISSNGKMLSLLDFKDEFTKLCETHEHVYYSRHPFVKSGDEEVLSYIKRHRNVTITDEPTYFLIASDEIKTVASLSSSVVHEAKYFSKNTKFFFKPVITIGNTQQCYSSVFQSFMFGHFWSDVLSSVFNVNKLEETSYFDGKDKIRDMLSFYWGYRNIDKLESLKQTVGSLYEKKNNVTTLPKKTQEPNWRAEIERSSIVSFDVFDTLISRSYYFPTDVFAFCEAGARQATNGKVKNFRNNRMLAEKKTREAQFLKDGKQEVSTLDVYDELARLYDLTQDEKKNLLELELTSEFRVSVRRDIGWAMYKYAKKLGKEIIAISDTTHTLEFITSLLNKSGYNEFTKIYVSSEAGFRKHEGELFDCVADELNIDRKDILHIGDNLKGDYQSAMAKGLQSYRIPRASENLEKAQGFTPLIQELKLGKTEFDSVLFSLIARNYYDSPTPQIKPKTLFNGESFNLGFSALGPVISGFAAWIYKEAIKSGITDIYFLSRDGLIAKKVFDALFLNVPNSPKTHYIYASRRAARVSSIYCLADILEIANKHIYATSIGEYLWSRFGLPTDSISDEEYKQFGFESGAALIGAKFPKDVILALIESISERILAAAKVERENYLKYLKGHNLDKAPSSALVDIGYAGSMQAALQRITNKNFLGLYFATFSSARNEPLNTEHMRGYVTHLSAANGKEHGIQTHRFVYESIFCAAHDSFICIENNQDTLTPVFDNSEHDDLRHSLITQIHGGVEAFAHAVATETNDTTTLNIEAKSSTRILDYWLQTPTIDDALILEGLRFHDPLGPSTARYIVLPRELKDSPDAGKMSIWPEGFRALQRLKGPAAQPVQIPAPAKAQVLKQSEAPSAPRVGIEYNIQNTKRRRRLNPIALVISPFESRIISKTCSEKKIEKYNNNRDKFFADAKKPIVRLYGKYSSIFLS
ncbi:HAD family hydrolase [Pseudomonas sp. GL-R-19]|uniref:HAD family hydrolase n=1 Tax=Pseudomonas sp. GL-R-19 TaxID=2832391 RepID=UPI001CBC3EF2|nr:HAD-IA family hydrolase [Pseudomonas sp. GL-R-19]